MERWPETWAEPLPIATGTNTWANGRVTIGMGKDPQYNDGRVEEGIWEHNILEYAQRVKPTAIVEEKNKNIKVIADVTDHLMLETNVLNLKRTGSCKRCYLYGANLSSLDLRGANLADAICLQPN